MNYDPRHPPAPYVTRANPDFDAWVEHRAIELCVDAVPEEHTQARPCWTHLQDARREGLQAWQARGGRLP